MALQPRHHQRDRLGESAHQNERERRFCPDWGAALLHRGDTGGAIEKFTLANQKSPHFADPLEMWGEALFYAGKKNEAKKQFAVASGLDLSNSDKSALAKWTARRG